MRRTDKHPATTTTPGEAAGPRGRSAAESEDTMLTIATITTPERAITGRAYNKAEQVFRGRLTVEQIQDIISGEVGEHPRRVQVENLYYQGDVDDRA